MIPAARGDAEGAARVSEEELRLRTPPVAGGREVRVGIFVLLGFASFLAVLFLLTDPSAFRGRYMLGTEVQDAGGIRRGDPVQMRGVNIGRVHDFELTSGGVLITLEIEGIWNIPSDSRTRLAGVDLLGGRTVEALPGLSEDALAEGDVMPGESVEGVLDLADEIGEEARVTMASLRSLLDEQAIAQLHASIGDLQALLGSMTALVEDQRDEIAALSSSLVRSAERVETFTTSRDVERGLARADSTITELRAAGQSLARASESFQVVIGRLERGEGTLGRLATDDELYVRFNAALEQITLLAQEVRDNPRRFIDLNIF